MNTAPAARRTHLLYLVVDADTRRELRFADHAEGVEVYSFDGLDKGVESTRIVSREEGRALWTAALAEGYVWTRSMVALPPAPPAPVEVAAPVALPAPAKPAAPSFEQETCSRCLGSGKHSYCQMHGDTCFKCGGKGSVLTKRGAAAMAHLRILRSKPVAALIPGDVVEIPGGGPFPARWETVDAAWIAAGHALGCSREGMVRVRQTREQSAATWDAALAYQATLTKAGTPRKVAKRAETVATA